MNLRSLRTYSLLAVLLTGAMTALPLRAQQRVAGGRDSVTSSAPAPVMSVPTANADSAAPLGPRAMPAGITRPVVASPLGAAEPQKGGAHVGAGENVALMVVGGAGVIIGLLIGGDGGTLLALGGGVIGLIGLFRYLK